jgi:hypothetical protein
MKAPVRLIPGEIFGEASCCVLGGHEENPFISMN